MERLLEGSGTADERCVHEVALVEPVASDRSTARFVYYEEAHAVWVCYEAGSAGSWRAGLSCLQEYVSHKLKRRLQHNRAKVAHGKAEAPRARRLELQAAIERIKRDILDMSIVFVAMRSGSRSGEPSSKGVVRQEQQAAGGHGGASLPEWLESALACGAAGCRGQRPRPSPLGDMPRQLAMGDVYPHAKVKLPLLLPAGYSPDWWSREEGGYREDDREELCCSFLRSCWRRHGGRASRVIPPASSPLCTACCYEVSGPSYLSLELPVLALQCAVAGGRAAGGGAAESSSCWLADCSPDGSLSVPCPTGMEGSEAPLSVLVASMRQAVQAWAQTEDGRRQAVQVTREGMRSGGSRSAGRDRGSGYV